MTLSLRGWQSDKIAHELFADNPDDKAALREQEKALQRSSEEGAGSLIDRGFDDGRGQAGEETAEKETITGGKESDAHKTSVEDVIDVPSQKRTTLLPIPSTTTQEESSSEAPGVAETYTEVALRKSKKHVRPLFRSLLFL